MGWKTHTVLIRPADLDGGPEKLLAELGYASPIKVSETSFADAGAGSIWIGQVADCVILFTYLALGFFGDEDRDSSEFKTVLLQRFADTDVAALHLHSVVGAWGFAVYQRGTLIRHQDGEDGVVNRDEGPRLPAEETCLARFERHDVNGTIVYRDPAHPDDDDMSDPNFGEDFVFEVCRSFTGFSLDQLDNVKGVNFWLSEEEKQLYAQQPVSGPVEMQAPRPWWKFWG